MSPAKAPQAEATLAEAIKAEIDGRLSLSAELYEACRPESDDPPDYRFRWSSGRAILAERLGEAELATQLYDTVVACYPKLRQPADESIYGLSNAAIWSADHGETRRVVRILKMFRAAAERQEWRGVTYEAPLAEARLAVAVDDLVAAERHWREVTAIIERTKQGELLPGATEEHALILDALGRRGEAIALLRPHVPTGEGLAYADLRTIPPAIALGTLLAESGPDTWSEARLTLSRALATEITRGQPEAIWLVQAALAEVAGGRDLKRAAILLGKAAVRIVATLDQAAHASPPRVARELEARLKVHRRLVRRLAEAGRFPEAAHVQSMIQQEAVFDLAGRRRDYDIRSREMPLTPGEERMLARFPLPDATAASDPRPWHQAAVRWVDDVMTEDWIAEDDRPVVPAARTADTPDVMHLRFFRAGEIWHGHLQGFDGTTDFAVSAAPEALARDIFAMREAIAAHGEGWRPFAIRLYDQLIRPIEDRLDGGKRLKIGMTDGPFPFLPFAALHDGRHFLIERTALSVDCGVTATRPPAPPRPTWRIRLLGAGGGENERLDHVAEELETIAAVLPQAPRIATLDAADLSEALRDGVEVVHLAGHFHLAPARFDRSYLVQADGTSLTLEALRSETFDFTTVELLTLSACDTAIGEPGPFGLGGLAGLARAKGARDVIGTLWQVADESAAELMCRFYEAGLAAEVEIPFAEALRRAQLSAGGRGRPPGLGATRARSDKAAREPDHIHPYHWAGFIHFD